MNISQDAVRIYVKGCDPVHWVHWFMECGFPDSKQRLREVLIDDEGLLIDLTAFGVAERVAEIIINDPHLLNCVINEMRGQME